MTQVSSGYGGVGGVNTTVNQAPTSFDSGVYTSADERDTGAASAAAASPPVPLERGRSSLRRGPLASVRYAGGAGGGTGGGVAAGVDTNNPSYNFQQVGRFFLNCFIIESF